MTKRYHSRKLVAQKIGAADKRRRPRGLTRPIRIAIDAMIFSRCKRADACKQAGITERALYLALEKMEVAAYWKRQTDVLRTGERAQNIHRLTDVRDQEDNRAASVKAVQVLEQLDTDAAARPAMPQQPGFVVIVQAPGATPAPPMVDVSPRSAPIEAERIASVANQPRPRTPQPRTVPIEPEPPAEVIDPPAPPRPAGKLVTAPNQAPVWQPTDGRIAPPGLAGIDAESRAPRSPRRRPSGRLGE